MRSAARRIRPDVVEVDPWVVLLHVGIGIAHEAGRRHAFLVGLPAPAAGLDLVSEVAGVDPTCCAVAGDAESTPSREREIVRQAVVTDRREICCGRWGWYWRWGCGWSRGWRWSRRLRWSWSWSWCW